MAGLVRRIEHESVAVPHGGSERGVGEDELLGVHVRLPGSAKAVEVARDVERLASSMEARDDAARVVSARSRVVAQTHSLCAELVAFDDVEER